MSLFVTQKPSDADSRQTAPMADAQQLRGLYDRYAEDLYRIAYRLTGSRADAEDVVQDVFLGLPTAFSGYQEQGKLDGWIRKVTVRVALARQRRSSRRREVPLESAPEPPSGQNIGATIEAIDLQRALDALPETLRSVLVLKELEGCTHEEIGELLGIRAGASKVRLHRAREMLRQRLKRTL
jgi:RNA polymerase sigma-70 factor, ECF subfamily